MVHVVHGGRDALCAPCEKSLLLLLRCTAVAVVCVCAFECVYAKARRMSPHEIPNLAVLVCVCVCVCVCACVHVVVVVATRGCLCSCSCVHVCVCVSYVYMVVVAARGCLCLCSCMHVGHVGRHLAVDFIMRYRKPKPTSIMQ